MGSYDAIMELMICVIDASHIVYSWCGPCKTLSPILERLAGDANTKTGSGRPIDLVTVDADEHDALAQRYKVCTTFLTHPTGDDDQAYVQVRALPTVVAFRGGEPVKQFVGALPEGGVRKFLEDV